MRQLLAFGSGNSFPGAPVAGVYLAGDNAAFLAACAASASTLYSIVVDVGSGGVLWYSQGGGTFGLIGGTVTDYSLLPTLGTVGDLTFTANGTETIYDTNNGWWYYWNGTAWTQLEA
jgi:hypothetical protein